MSDVTGAGEKACLHWFKHARLNFYVRRVRYRGPFGELRFAMKRRKYKQPVYVPAPGDREAALIAATKARTKQARDAAVARHRAAHQARNIRTQQAMIEAIDALSEDERRALQKDPHAISAMEKMLEKMLFRFA